MSLENVTSIDSYFQELEKKLVLKSACNLTTEKIKFFNSNYTYNPQFIYPEPTPCTFSSQIDKQIQQIGDPIIGKLYEAKHEEYKQKHKFLSSSGNSEEEFTKQSILFFGKPEEFALAIAHQICENLPQLHFGRKNKANIRFRTIAKRLRAYLKQHKFKGKLNVLHGKTVANHVSVSKAKGTLNISRNYISDEDELTDIIYHEIETHMRRLENATKLKYELFRLGTARYLAYEEGLAT
ncbi:DUF1704 domain-containing protein, partial [Candidatus Dojkabacteria bacterium]|nr:DUF1704 domain-containing protein [Candidatus Dojkabacteria bacterium]